MNTILFYPKPKHTIFLVDGSGSMEPAWTEAWSSLFDQLKNTNNSFSILLFKQPRYMTDVESNAVLDTDNHFYAIIDIAKMLREKNLVRIKRTPMPEEIGVRFRGRTPLLAAIHSTIRLARENYPAAELEVIVVSDNRDSMVHEKGYEHNDADIIVAKTEEGVRLKLLPVGSVLNRYTGKYDDILSAQPTSVSTLVSLI